jgi:signal transduction histidine kinase
MTGIFLLDWTALAVSLINTILLLWLGFTVLLNAERRTWGVWLAGGGLLLSGAFFLSHSAILGLGPFAPGPGMNILWRLSWLPVVIMPYAWYLVMLWYASYWDDPQGTIRQRHRLTLFLASLLALATVSLTLLFNALPSFSQLVQLNLGGVLSVGGIPVLMIIYPVYLLTSLGFSLDVLLHPGTPIRIMGGYARQRARPWLLLATFSLLLVSLLVGSFILWGISIASKGIYNPQFVVTIAGFDLAIELFIASTILSVGQATVSYEIFTGKFLPRGGLKRYWIISIFLAIGFGVIISWALLYPLHPIYIILLVTVFMTVIYSLLTWQVVVEREGYIKAMNPFITSQHLYDQLLLPISPPTEFDITVPFYSLCQNILGLKQAYLIPLGVFGPLVGEGISYPPRVDPDWQEIIIPEVRRILTINSRFTQVLSIESSILPQNSFLLPLWSERGLIGAMVLGEKNDGRLFTQEETEIARTVGERLIDNKASSELAFQLMELQRQHLAETQVIDQRTRRTLHDDVLPHLHTTILSLNLKQIDIQDAVRSLGEIHSQLSALLRELPSISAPEVARHGLVQALHQTVDEEFRYSFNNLTWQIDPMAVEKSNSISALAAEVLYYAAREAVRNAARHGCQPASDHSLNLTIDISWKDRLMICIQDDGIGFDEQWDKGENHGQGLALHSTLMAVVGGSLAIESVPGKNTQVILKLPA